MVILLIIKRFDFGGAENHVCELANNLSVKGHKVFLIGRKGRQVRKLLPAVRYLDFYLNDILLPLQVIALSVIVLRNRVDLIHGHQRLGILAASLAGFITRTKVIATVHGRTRYDLKHALSRWLTDRFIFVSRKVLENASNKFNLDGSAVLISNGVEIAPKLRTPDPYTICHISRVDRPHYGFLRMMIEDVLPVLLKKYPSLQLLVLGDGPLKDKLKEAAEKLNREFSVDCCMVSGYRKNVVPYYRCASLVLGVGRVALEASSLSVPVMLVSSKRMGGMLTWECYDTVKETNFVHVQAPEPDTASMIAEIEIYFSRRSEMEKRAGELALQVREDFSMEKITEKTLSVYSELVETG